MKYGPAYTALAIIGLALVGTNGETGNTQTESVKIPASPCACESCECRDELLSKIEELEQRLHEFETSSVEVVEEPEVTGYEVLQQGNRYYWQVGNQWWNCQIVSDGSILQGGQWQYSNGIMIDLTETPQMSTKTQAPSGWSCNGNSCVRTR